MRFSVMLPAFFAVAVCAFAADVTSTLEVVSIADASRRIVYVTAGRMEAPNWTADGKALVFNRDGHLYRIASGGGKPEMVEIGRIKAGHHHGISPDGTTLAITDEATAQAGIYTMPLAGGATKLVTSQKPSYWKGWSPDGKWIVYTARRDGKLGLSHLRGWRRRARIG